MYYLLFQFYLYNTELDDSWWNCLVIQTSVCIGNPHEYKYKHFFEKTVSYLIAFDPSRLRNSATLQSLEVDTHIIWIMVKAGFISNSCTLCNQSFTKANRLMGGSVLTWKPDYQNQS